MSKLKSDLRELSPAGWLDRLTRRVLSLIWLVRVAYCSATGRWHIFREYPSWFVIQFIGHDAGTDDPLMTNVAQQARAEMELRINRMGREIEGLVKQKDDE